MDFKQIHLPDFSLIKKSLDKGISPNDGILFCTDYAYARDGGQFLEKETLIDRLNGKHLPMYETFNFKKKNLVAERANDGNCLLVTIYNLVLLRDNIETSSKDRLFLGEIIEDMCKHLAKVPSTKKFPLKDDESVDQMEKKDKDGGVDVMRRKLGHLAAKLTVDIDFAKGDITTNSMEFYQLEKFVNVKLLENRKHLLVVLNKLKIKVLHGWIPEDSNILPPEKRSLQMLFEARDSTTSSSEEKVESWKSFIKGTQLTKMGLKKIHRNMKNGSYAILLLDYSFHVICRTNDEVYLLSRPNPVVRDNSPTWVKLETMIHEVKVSDDKMDQHKKVYLSMEKQRKICKYIEAHKEIFLKRPQRQVSEEVSDEVCKRCCEGTRMITHNVNGLIRLLLEISNCWEDFYSKFHYVCWEEIKLIGFWNKESRRMEIDMDKLNDSERLLIEKFLATVEKDYVIYWALSTKRHSGVALFCEKDLSSTKCDRWIRIEKRIELRTFYC